MRWKLPIALVVVVLMAILVVVLFDFGVQWEPIVFRKSGFDFLCQPDSNLDGSDWTLGECYKGKWPIAQWGPVFSSKRYCQEWCDTAVEDSTQGCICRIFKKGSRPCY
jgi:hypothetical protein